MKRQFRKLWTQLGASNNPDSEFQFLEDTYSQPGRFYHNLSHIRSCLRDFREVSCLINSPELVELAIWYHDVVYDVNRSDNEQKSADLALDLCSRAELSNETAREIYELILITKHNTTAGTVNQKIITDVDLAILGKLPLEYDLYEKAIRKEYSDVPEDDFRKGRTAILQTFLDKSSIYSLECFKQKYQRQAVKNIQKAILDLV